MQFIDKSVNTEALSRFFNKMKENDCDIHTFQVYQGGKRLVRMSLPPYSCDDVRENFSLSKTFAATVVGRAADMGLLSQAQHTAHALLAEDPALALPAHRGLAELVSHLYDRVGGELN